MMSNDAASVEGLEGCFFDDDFVQGEASKGKESTAGRWTHAEHEMFVKGLELHSKQWKLIAELIKTRTVVQVRTHAQKYFQKLLKQAKNDGSLISDDAFADLFNDSSSDLLAGLKRKNNSPFSVKNKVKRTESNMSLNMETLSRASSDSDIRGRTEGDKKKKSKSDGSKSPSPRSVVESDAEPYLNSYPIQASDGCNYPQSNVTTEGNPQAGDWFNLGQSNAHNAHATHGAHNTLAAHAAHTQPPTAAQRYPQNPTPSSYGMSPAFGYSDSNTNYASDPSNYTHGICCNATTANYYQSQSYPIASTHGQINQNTNQMEFPDPFGIGGGDFNSIDRGDFSDLIWYDIDDIPGSAESVSEERIPSGGVTFIKDIIQSTTEQLHQQHGNNGITVNNATYGSQHSIQEVEMVSERNEREKNVMRDKVLIKTDSSNSVYSSETSSAFGSSEAYTSYEESSLMSCTSSDDGNCFEDFDIAPCDDLSMGDAMAVLANSQKRRLSKSSLALNNMNNVNNMYSADIQLNEHLHGVSENCHEINAIHSIHSSTMSVMSVMSEMSEKINILDAWSKEDDEELVLGIVEAFSS